MTASLSPQFGAAQAAPSVAPPKPISAPQAEHAAPPLAIGASTFNSFQRQTAWRSQGLTPYSAQAGGRSTYNFDPES